MHWLRERKHKKNRLYGGDQEVRTVQAVLLCSFLIEEIVVIIRIVIITVVIVIILIHTVTEFILKAFLEFAFKLFGIKGSSDHNAEQNAEHQTNDTGDQSGFGNSGFLSV